MTDDNGLSARTWLRPCFATSIEVLDGALRKVVEAGASGATALPDIEACLLTIRANAASNTPGLYSALDAVRAAFRAVEDIVRRPAVRVLNQEELVVAALSHADSAVQFLVEVLRMAKPNVRSA